MRRPLAALAAMALIASCGEPAELPAGSADGGSPPPATRLVTPLPEPGDADFVAVTAVDAVEVTVPCPSDVPVDMNATEPSIFMSESSRLEPMLGVVLQYGSAHPEVFGGYGLHWLSSADASVFVSFTTGVDEHRAALAGLVEYPDELIVCQAAATETERNAIQATLLDELNGRFLELSSGGKSGAVNIGLNPTEEALAAQLVERYGAAIEVSVGALSYPLASASPTCDAGLPPSLIGGLDVGIMQAEPIVMTDAGTVRLTVELRNDGAQPIRFGSGYPSTVITDAQGGPRTRDLRAVAAVGIEIALEPGASETFDVDVSLASCDPAVGYVLPPGDHFLVVSIYNAELQTNMHSVPLPFTIESSTR